MFPTQVTDWQTQPRVGSPPIGTGSSFDVTNNPLEEELKQLASAPRGRTRRSRPAGRSRATRRAASSSSAASTRRRRPSTSRPSTTARRRGRASRVQTSTAGKWTTLLPAGIPASTSSSSGKLDVTVRRGRRDAAEGRRAGVRPRRAPKPKLTVAPDDLSNLFAATATVTGNAPVSVAFAVLRAGTHTWQRLDVDTSPPYRGFLDPAKFKQHEHVQVVAIARALDGSTRPVVRRVSYTVRPCPDPSVPGARSTSRSTTERWRALRRRPREPLARGRPPSRRRRARGAHRGRGRRRRRRAARRGDRAGGRARSSGLRSSSSRSTRGRPTTTCWPGSSRGSRASARR